MSNRIVIICCFIAFILFTTQAQNKSEPFKYNISEDGERYIKFGFNSQLWGRYTELNPNSKVGNNETDHTFDIVLRRLRIQALGMITKKVFFHIQIGQNNINFIRNKKPYNTPLSLLDLLGEYHFSKQFKLGIGLTGWGAGTTRYSAQSSCSQLTLDAPIYQQNNTSSIFGNRNLSIYAKGELGKLRYNVAVNNPYRQSENNLNQEATIATLTPKPQYVGMITYQFLDKESISEPYSKGTYLGKKKVLNIGIGYMFQSNAMWRYSPLSDTITENMRVFGADIFYDTPLNKKGAALTVYVAYNNCNYGLNYLRTIATPNPASSGNGNGFYGIGTGNIFYGQMGYLFNKRKDETKKGRPQVYIAYQIAALQALNKPMTMFETGINYYLTDKSGPKISLGYQNRAIFTASTDASKKIQNGRKGMLVLQYQISF